MFNVNYIEYMEYEEEIEATNIDEAKRQFEIAVEMGQVEPIEARVLEYKVMPKI